MRKVAMITALVIFGFFLCFWSWCPGVTGLRIESKHSYNGHAFAEVILWGADREWSIGLEIETEGSCPFPILWPPTQIEGGLSYEIPLSAPCLKHQFTWTVMQPSGIKKELHATLEAKSKAEMERSKFILDHVSDVR